MFNPPNDSPFWIGLTIGMLFGAFLLVALNPENWRNPGE